MKRRASSARVGRRDARPARDLRVLAGGDDRRHVALLGGAERDTAPSVEPRRDASGAMRHQCARLPPCAAVHRPLARSSSGSRSPRSPGRRSATASSSRCCGARARNPPVAPGGDPGERDGRADRRRVRRGGRDRGEGRERARARLAARPARRSSSPSTAAPSRAPTRPPSVRARPAPTSCSSCRASGKVRAQDAAVAATPSDVVAFSDANSTWEPGALRALAAPFADPAVGYVCGQVRFVNEDGHQPGGPVLALRDVAAGERVRARVGHRRQRRDLRRAARGVPARRRGHGPRPLVPVQHRQARAGAPSTRRRRARRRRWCRRSRARARASGG